MAYASLPDVQALEPLRVYDASTAPNPSQVGEYLDNRAAEIDAILVEKGYALPVPTTASSALLLLRKINAQGAWADVSTAAAGSPYKDSSQKAYDAALEMLKAANTVLDMPKDETRASPRGPGVTTAPGVIPGRTFNPNAAQLYGWGSGCNPRDNGAPMFARDMQF